MPKSLSIRTALTVLVASFALTSLAAHPAVSSAAAVSATANTTTTTKAAGYWTWRWVWNGYSWHRVRVWVAA